MAVKIKLEWVTMPSADMNPDNYQDEVDEIEDMIKAKYSNGYELIGSAGGDKYILFTFKKTE